MDTSETVTNRLDVVASVEKVVTDLESTTFNSLVPNSVIDKVWDDLNNDRVMLGSNRASWAARHAVFSSQLQSHFKSAAQYHNAAYAAWSCNEQSQILYKGTSPQVVEALRKFRTTVMGMGRQYLRNPDNLWALYQSKRAYLEGKLAALDKEDRKQLIAWVEASSGGLEAFLSPEFQEIYPRFLEAQEDWMMSWEIERRQLDVLSEAHSELVQLAPKGELQKFLKSVLPDDYRGPNGRELQRQLEDLPLDLYPRLMGYSAAINHYIEAVEQGQILADRYEVARKAIEAASPDVYATLFAGRRHSEGGDELVLMYIKIAKDFLQLAKESSPSVELISFEIETA